MSAPNTVPVLAMRHLRFGWFSLAAFVTLGLILEVLHGLKIGWYLDVSHETRRMMFTLAHAHGTLLALVNLAFSAALRRCPAWSARPRQVASYCLLAASVLMPAGFFAGGLVIYGGDPGIGVFLVPPAAVLLIVSVVLTALATLRAGGPAASQQDDEPRPPVLR